MLGSFLYTFVGYSLVYFSMAVIFFVLVLLGVFVLKRLDNPHLVNLTSLDHGLSSVVLDAEPD